MGWAFDSVENAPGAFRIIMRKPDGHPVDITTVRGAPTIIESLTKADPFGDATAVLRFPQVSGFDDFDAQDVGGWLDDFSDVDIYFQYAYPVRDLSYADCIDPRTNQQTLCISSDYGALLQHWMPPVGDPGWVAPMDMSVTATNPPNRKAGYPTSWSDNTAYWLWPGPHGPAETDHPYTRGLFRTTFNLASSTQITLDITADNIFAAWLDDDQIIGIEDTQNWKTFHTVTVTLPAGDHELTACVINSPGEDFVDGETQPISNPGGYLFSLRKTSDDSIIVNSSTFSTLAQRIPPQRVVVWEGYIASLETSVDGQNSDLTVQCQGSLFQADRYLQKPAYPPRPIPHERLIADVFSHVSRPSLRTKSLEVRFPVGWTKVVPAYKVANAYTLDARPGTKYSGYSSRNTGSWDHALTNFCADLLAVMFVDEKSGVTVGNQWTVLSEPGRKPVLKVRDRFRTPDFELWYGQTGITGRFTKDNTQMVNIIYGEGTAVDGSTWRNARISNDGTRTEYAPLASSPDVFPLTDNPALNKKRFVSESLIKYGSGFGQDQATSSAKQTLTRDQIPGWTGEITLTFDPGMSKWAIRAGMTCLLKGFAGTGETGMRFHIAQVQGAPEQNTVTLTLDTRYRDLLTLEEARARTMDPLTPSKLLQINKRNLMIEDTMAPWDYTAGSGFIPQKSTKFHSTRPHNTVFPWEYWTKLHPPRQYPQWYVRCNADKARRIDRWSGQIPIYMGQKGSIRRVEVAAFDVNGKLLPIQFHMSLYYNQGDSSPMDMPRDGQGPSPFITNAFQTTDANGALLPAGNFLAASPDLIIGWGNKDQPAGYFPSRKSDGASPTGLLVDEASWNWDCLNNGLFANQQQLPGKTYPKSYFNIFAEFYAEYTEPVYFMGRLYRMEPGT